MKKILYVDDEVVNLKVFELNFAEKYEVLTARGGEKAIELMKKTPDIGVVISDMKMPLMTGLEFIKMAQSTWDQVNYYILTGYAISDEIEEAIASGIITKYFKKPSDLDEIEEEIDQILE